MGLAEGVSKQKEGVDRTLALTAVVQRKLGKEEAPRQTRDFHACRMALLFAVVVAKLLVSHGGGGAHGANLGSVTAGTTFVVGDTVPSGAGAELKVSDMITSADADGSESAQFHAERLVFEGPLTITCPSGAATYTKPLMVTIVNGSSSTIYDAHIKISGVLGGGSRISIVGGSYTFPNANPSAFLQVTATLSMSASTLEVVGVSVVLPTTVIGGGNAALLYSSAAVSISTNSTITIANIAIGVYNVSLSSGSSVSVYYTDATFPINVAANSTLSITNATIDISNMRVGSALQLCVINSKFAVSASTSSTISIANASIKVRGLMTQDGLSSHIMFVDAAVSVSARSALYIRGSTVDAHIVVDHYSSWSLSALTTTSLSASSSSTLQIASTTLKAHNASLGGGFTMYVVFVYTTSLSVSANSTLSLADSFLVAKYVVTGLSEAWSIRIISANSIAVAGSSTASISDSGFDVSNSRVAGDCLLGVVFSSNTVSVQDSSLTAHDTTARFQDTNVEQSWTFNVVDSMGMITSSNSNLSITNTAVWASDFTVGPVGLRVQLSPTPQLPLPTADTYPFATRPSQRTT